MKTILQSGDHVHLRVNGRRRRCVVQDVLPIAQDAVPIRWRKKVVWVDRAKIRKLPSK